MATDFTVPYQEVVEEDDDSAVVVGRGAVNIADVATPKTARQRLRLFLESLPVVLAVVFLVLLDFSILLYELLAKDSYFLEDKKGEVIVTIVILSLLSLEVCLRLIAKGVDFLKNPLDLLDAAIMVTSIVVELLAIDLARFIVILRILRAVRVVYVTYRSRKRVPKALRKHVSANRRRHQDNEFDLDITYITKRVLAMSVPAVGTEAIYRNPVETVALFFNTKHGGHYRIFNLCAERDYPVSSFDTGSVQRWPMNDHSVVPIRTILALVEEAASYLERDSANVVVVHCKGGKGRTGTIVCSLLMAIGAAKTAASALDYFAERRTADDVEKGVKEGVETPSQARYVGYMGRVLAQGLPETVPIVVDMIVVENLSVLAPKFDEVWIVVDQDLETVFRGGSISYDSSGNAEIKFPGEYLIVAGDVHVTLYKNFAEPTEIFGFWCHTSYLPGSPWTLQRTDLDGIHKKKHAGKAFGVAMSMHYETLTARRATASISSMRSSTGAGAASFTTSPALPSPFNTSLVPPPAAVSESGGGGRVASGYIRSMTGESTSKWGGGVVPVFNVVDNPVSSEEAARLKGGGGGGKDDVGALSSWKGSAKAGSERGGAGRSEESDNDEEVSTEDNQGYDISKVASLHSVTSEGDAIFFSTKGNKG